MLEIRPLPCQQSIRRAHGALPHQIGHSGAGHARDTLLWERAMPAT